MARSVAFLRSINVGGRRLTNDVLVSAVEGLGFSDVAAYQASGNVLFEPGDDPEPALTLSRGLEAALGFAVPVFVRTAAQVHAIAAEAPFSEARLEGTRRKVQVTFLAVAPDPPTAARAEALSTEQDRIRVIGDHWFWLPTGGISDSPLDFGAVERLVGVGTTRTQGTVQRIAKKIAR